LSFQLEVDLEHAKHTKDIWVRKYLEEKAATSLMSTVVHVTVYVL
jgi:hypothetical protein